MESENRESERLPKIGIVQRFADYVNWFLIRLAHIIATCADFSLALLMTAIFYYPSLRNGSEDAGYIYTGDVLGYFLPALMKTHHLIGNGHFDALDFSLFDGSSDFFLSPNFFATHPIVALFCLLWPQADLSLPTHRLFLVLLMAFHTFVAAFFTLRLARFHLGLERPAALLAAVSFAFSMYMVAATGQPPFIFCTGVLPWIVCSVLDFTRSPSCRRMLFAMLPTTCALLGGYAPLGAACIGLSLIFVFIILYIKNGHWSAGLTSDCVHATVPYAAAALLMTPFFLAISSFHAETMSRHSGGVHYSAHQLAASPQTIYGVLSAYLLTRGPTHEFIPIMGVVPLLIIVMFVSSPSQLQARSRIAIAVFASMYCVALLAIYGDHSVIADMVYYFVPKIGRMHIYQRFLLLVQLAFGLILAIMAQSLGKGPIPHAKQAIVVLFSLSILSGFVTALFPRVAETVGMGNHLTIELITGCILAATMLSPHPTAMPAAAAILFCLPSFDRMYDRSHYGNTFAEVLHKCPLALDEDLKQRIANFFTTSQTQKRIKYVDITPIWDAAGGETFPKVFPYFVLQKAPLTSFGGFTFYLSARADFLQHAPVRGDAATVDPDWNLVEESSVDFVVARREDMLSEALRRRLGVREEESLALPKGVNIYRTHFDENGSVSDYRGSNVDNGLFRLLPMGDAQPPERENLAKGKSVRQSSTAGGPATRAIDGNRSGEFAHGSVTHTEADPNAWLEIDLGDSTQIGLIHVWGRTDGTQDRLADYSIIISESRLPDRITVEELRGRTDAHIYPGLKPMPDFKLRVSEVTGRYVRIQLSGKANPLGDYLSIAECEVYSPEKEIVAESLDPPSIEACYSNDANFISMTIDAPAPVIAQYLLWPNPRASFYLNGSLVAPTDVNGLAAIKIPAGRHVLEMRYRHWPLRVFWIFYAGFGLALVAATIPRPFHRTTIWLVNALYGVSPFQLSHELIKPVQPSPKPSRQLTTNFTRRTEP